MLLSTRQFHYDAKTKVLTAELAELREFRFEQVYPDAADMGFTMVSDKTGRLVDFVQTATDTTDGGEDVAGWWFEPKPEHIRKNPNVRGVRVLIIND